MAAQQLRLKEDKRLAEFAQEPGMTHVKKPRTASLVKDGVIDLKRVRVQTFRFAPCSVDLSTASAPVYVLVCLPEVHEQ